MATNRRLLNERKGPVRDLDAERKKANELEVAALTNTLLYGNAYKPLQRKSIFKKDLVTGDVRIQTPKETKETDTALQKIGNEQKQREEAKNSGANVSKIKWKQSVVDHSTNNDTSAYTDFTDSVIKNARESRKTEYDHNKKLEETRKERSDYFRLKSGWKSENSPNDAVNVDAYTSYDSTKPISKDDVITAGNELAEKIRKGTATDDDYRKYVNTEALYGEGMYNAFNDRISVAGRNYGVVSDDDIWKSQEEYEAEANALYGDINALFEKFARGEATDAELNAMGARKKKFDEREKVYLSDEWSRRGTIESAETLNRQKDNAKKAYEDDLDGADTRNAYDSYLTEAWNWEASNPNYVDGVISDDNPYKVLVDEYSNKIAGDTFETYQKANAKYQRAFAADSYKKIEDTYDEYKKEMTASGYKFNGVMENGGQVSYGNTYSDFVSKMYNQNASEGEDYHVDELRDYGTEEQKAVFTYLYQTKGREAALKYSLEINPIIAEQAHKANKKKYEDSGDWGRLGMGISDSFMGGLAGDFIYNMEGVGRLLTGDTSYHFQNVAQQKANAVSEAEENPVAKFSMAALRTTGAQIPMIITSMATGGASGVLGKTSSVLFFASAAGSSYSESINKGNGWFESVGYAGTVAAFELLTEKIFDVPGIYGGSKVDDAVKGALSKGIGRLSTGGKTKSALTFAGYLGVNALGEGFEEGVAELFSPVWSNLWLGEQNEMFTEEHWKEIGYASLLGTASSFLMAGPSMPYLYSEAKGNTAVWSVLNGKAKSVYEIDAVLNNESSKKLFEKVIGIELSDNTDVARMQVAAVSSAVSAWYAKNSGKKVSDLMKTLTVSDAGSVAEFVEKAAEVIPEPDAEYVAKETAAVAEMTEIANKELKKTTVDEKAVPETAAGGIKIDEDGSIVLPTAAEEWDAALKRSEAETLLYLKKLDASVLADGGVSTTELSDLLKDKNTARSIFVEYSKSHFPSSITNLETGHEIGISRNGIDKFLSGNISKEKYATGLKIPQLVESAHKVAEADNKKGKAGISGYEYYENKIKVDGNDYNVYIRVRNTDMGDRYYGHTIGKAVEDIKIEPSAWNSDGDTSVHSINALDSDNIIPQRTPGVKMANDGSIMLPTAEGEINAAAANKKDILPGFSDVTTETTEMTGRACGVSEENIGIAVRLSHALGVKVAFYEDLTSDERGQYLPKTGVIWVNSKYQDVFSNVFGHELTHKIESSRFYKALDRVVAGKLKAEGKSMDELIRRKKESYGRRGASLSDEAARREVVAKYVGEVLLNNEAVIADIANTDRGLGGFLLSKIDSLVAKITGKNKEAVYIRRVQQMFRKALEDVSRKEGAKVSDGSKQQRGSVYEDAGLNELAERYRRGDLSQAEYLEAYNEYMERNPGLEDDGEFDRSFDLDEDSFINQLEDWKKYKGKKGGSYNGTYFDLGTTPDVFTKHGASAHQLIMLEECLIKVTGGKHAISTDELKKLPSELNDPILLFKSSYTGKNGKLQKAFVALTEMVDIHNNDVVVAIHIDKYQDRLIVNKISSLYSKSDDITFKNRIISYVNNQISAGNLIDASTKKAPIWFTSRGLQLPKLVQTIIDANNSISQNKGFVNTQNKNNSGMQNNENAPDASKRFHRVLKQDYNGQYDFDDANDFVDDETYMDAVNRGDMDTAQRLVEKAAKESGRTVKVYHGTPRFGFTKLDTRKSDDRISVFATSSLNLASTYSGVDNERQINTANDKDVYTAEDVNRVEKAIEAFVEKANSIAQTEIANSDSVPFHKYLKQIKKGKDEIAYKIKKLDEFDFFAPIQVEQVIDDVADIAKSNNLADATKQLDDLRRASEDVINAIDEMKNAFSGNYGFYADVDNLLEVEGNGANWKEIPFDMIPGQKTADTREIAEWAKKNGYAGVQFKNIYDSGGRTNLAEASDVYAFFNPKTQLKSADPVTYDNKGKVIPLSKRFNYNNSDIRYDFDDANDYSSATGVVTAEKAEEKPAKSTRRTRKADTRKATEDRLFNKRELERLAKIKSELEDADELTVEQVTSLWGEMRKLQRNVTAMSMAHQITNEELTQVTDLLRGDRTIEDIEKLPADRYNIDGIIAVAKAKLEYENVASQIREYKARHKARLYEVADGYVAGNVIDDKKGPAAGLRYRRETMERNVRDVVKDKDKAEGIIDEYFKPVHKNEADRTRFKEKLRDRIRKLGISTKVEKGNQVSEAYAVQFYGEVADNIAYLEQNQNRVKHREGKNLEEWRALEKALWEDNPNLDKNKIVRAVEEFRKIYDELYQNMNEVRVRNGYEPVKYRRGYFPHFAPGTSDGVLAKIAKGLGINSEVTDLPTTINGLTHTFKPGIKWMGNILARTGFATEYDALTGFDRYLEAASDVIFHTDDIQRLRALSSRIRYNASDDGIKKRADAISKNEELREEEKQAALDGLYKEGKFTGSNFTVVLDDYTNILAGKKSISDRNAEYNLGRKMYNVVKGLESRIAANMIAGNLASALTNFIPITQAVSVIRLDHVLHGAFNTVLGKDGMQDMSDFLVNRRGSDLLTETTSEWISKKLSKPMEFIDSFASGFIVRARYYENLQRGLSEDAALEEADSFAASVIADRSKGSMPVLFEQKNPLMKLFTQFQLEVNNQLSFATKDLWRYESAKAETGKNRLTNKVALRYVWGLFWFAIMAFLFDELYEWLIGRRPALDPIGMALDYADDAQEDGWFEALGGLGEDVAENMPFIGGLMGGGRVPISSALPDINKIYNSLSGDANWKKKAVTVGKEISKPFIYLVPPFGGGLGKKVIEGASGMIQGGSYTADSDGNAELQYPIYKDSVGDTIWNGAKSVLFGRTSTAGGKKWIKDGFKNFTADYTEAYKDMIELDGVSQKEAYEFLDGLRNVKDPQKGDDVSVDDLKRQYIEESGIDDSAKGIAYYYALASENEKDVLDSYRDSEEFGAISGVLMGMKEHGNSVQPKRELLLESELDSSVKRDIYESIIVSSDDKEKESAKIDAFEDAGMTVDDYLSCRNKKYELDNDDGLNASGRATEFARWVDNNFKPKQAGIIKENVKFSSGFSVSADGYEKYREAGLSPDEAYNLINGFGELEPEDGKEQVSDWQKARVIVDGDLSDEDKLTSLGVVLSSGTYERVSTAYDKGISFERYFDVKDEYDSKKANYSADEKDAYADRWNSTHGRTSGKTKLTFNQIMMYEAIEGIGGDLTASGGIMTTAPKYSFTKRDKAVLWQILDGEWSHEKNPFDTSVGLDVRKSMGWVD